MTSGPAFRLLLSRLADGEERAGVEFERIRRALTKFFDWRGASWPEECADETLDRLARRLHEGVVVVDLPGFAHGIARLVLREHLRSESRRASLDAVPRVLHPGEATEGETLARYLELCLERLSREDKDLVLTYYAGARGRSKIEGRRRLARRLRLTDNALRSRVQRLRDRLEDCVRSNATGEGVRIPR